MAHAYYHAVSSARRYGGIPEDYLELHRWFDQTKAHIPDARHRMVLHNSFGIFLCEQVFGMLLIRKSDGMPVPTRLLGEQHVQEDLGRIPSLVRCFEGMDVEPWMARNARRLSVELAAVDFGGDHDTDREGARPPDGAGVPAPETP